MGVLCYEVCVKIFKFIEEFCIPLLQRTYKNCIILEKEEGT